VSVLPRLIAVVAIGHLTAKGIMAAQHKHQSTNAVLGDLLSQKRQDGGLGLGTTETSMVFLVLILGLVIYLTVTRRESRGIQRSLRARGRSARRASSSG